MDNKRKNGTPQPHPKFYLVPPMPKQFTTGEAPFFSMSPEPETARLSFSTPYKKHER